MTDRECKVFGILPRYLRDRKIVYRRAAHSIAEKDFEDELLWSQDVSVRHIDESGNVVTPVLGAKSTPIGGLLLFVMDIVIQVRLLTGLGHRNSILAFCLAMDSIVIWKYEREKRAALSEEAMSQITKQLDALKNARGRMLELRAARHKGQPYAPHFKLI